MEDGASCDPCPAEDDDRYSIQERTVTAGAAPSAWRILGYTCLSAGDLGEIDAVAITPDMVVSDFRRLDWPSASLSLEPGEGMTLVNMRTNAFTENPGPRSQTVTLLGQTVEIEATPDSWTWHWGDGSVDSTTHPGQLGAQGTVTHAYRRAADSVEVRVDLTYRGRFRVNGGAWQTIPASATVRGESQSISVNEAVVRLVR